VIAEVHPSPRRPIWLVAPLTAFALAALTAGLIARERLDPSKELLAALLHDTLHLKAWCAAGLLFDQA
jgi:hypothetical protein